MTVSAFGVLYSLRVHFFERILRANTADMLKLGGTLPPPSEAADPRLLLCASDPDPRRPPRPPPPSLPLPPRPRATGTRSSPLGFATKEKENMARIDARSHARTPQTQLLTSNARGRANPSCCGAPASSLSFSTAIESVFGRLCRRSTGKVKGQRHHRW